MSEKNNGGPAFPKTANYDQLGQSSFTSYDQDGMTLRDYFAAKAMQAELMTNGVPGKACEAMLEIAAKKGRDPLYHMACNAYEAADAMLKARQS